MEIGIDEELLNMIIDYYKQNSSKSSSGFFKTSNYSLIKVVVGKQMKQTHFVQVAFYNGLQGSMIGKGYISINTFFKIAHNSKFKVIFNKKHFKNFM